MKTPLQLMDSLFEKLISELQEARSRKRAEHARVLPIGDYLSDRSEKARYLGFGEGSTIYDSSLVLGEVRVGRNVWVGPFTILDGSGGPLVIGDHCNLSAGVQIYTHDTVDRVLSDSPIAKGPVTIGSRVYLGPNVVVALGVTIGDGAVVGANSLVLEDVPAGARVHGNPARVIGRKTE